MSLEKPEPVPLIDKLFLVCSLGFASSLAVVSGPRFSSAWRCRDSSVFMASFCLERFPADCRRCVFLILVHCENSVPVSRPRARSSGLWRAQPQVHGPPAPWKRAPRPLLLLYPGPLSLVFHASLLILLFRTGWASPKYPAWQTCTSM